MSYDYLSILFRTMINGSILALVFSETRDAPFALLLVEVAVFVAMACFFTQRDMLYNFRKRGRN